jgi:hypothetical protein
MNPPGTAVKAFALPLLMILMVVIWLVVRGPAPQGDQSDTDVTATTASTGTTEDVADLPGGAVSAASDGKTEAAVKRETLASPADVGGDPVGPRRVKVRAELTLTEGRQGFPPPGCAGWEVVAQSWIEETGEVERFTAVADEHGIAEFIFPDFVHIDWVVCLPPHDSGFGLAVVEEHEDIRAGDDYLVLLPMRKGNTAVGKVVDWDGDPVPAATVHLYWESGSFGLGDWTPGFLSTRTDAAGRFRFDQLSPAQWVVAVEPDDWMMFDPGFEQQDEGRGYVDIEYDYGPESEMPPPDPYDFGTLGVVPIDSLELEVTDSAGLPLVGQWVVLQPLGFDEPRFGRAVEPDLDEEQEELLRFLHEQDATALPGFGSIYWEDDTTWLSTGRSGTVMLRLPAGRWRLDLDETEVLGLRPDDLPPLIFHTREGKLSYRVPLRIGSFEGRLRRPDGRGTGSALMTLEAVSGGGQGDRYDCTVTDDGRFSFPRVVLGSYYTLRAWPTLDCPDFFTADWTVLASPGDTIHEFLVTTGASTTLQFEALGATFDDCRAMLRPLGFHPGPGTSPTAVDDWWASFSRRTFRLDKDYVVLRAAPPGELDFSIDVRTGSGRWDPHGRPGEGMRPWGRYSARIGVPGQKYVIDLRSYDSPELAVAEVVGRLTRSSGEALADVRMLFIPEGGGNVLSTYSRSDGSFTIRLCVGNYEVQAARPTTRRVLLTTDSFLEGLNRRSYSFDPAEDAVDLQLLTRDGMEVPDCMFRFFDSSGQAMKMPVVRFSMSPLPLHEVHASGGNVQICDIPEGSITLEARFFGIYSQRCTFTAPAGGGGRVEVRLALNEAELVAALAATAGLQTEAPH